ncbi:MAG: flagellar biosynthetic protein FliO [Myxococcales bacterium]
MSAASLAAAQDKPTAAPEAPAAAAAQPAAQAPAAAAAPASPSASAAPAQPFKIDKPSPDDFRFERSEYGEDTESLIGSLVRMVLVLGLVLALVYVSLNWGLRKLMKISPTRHAVVKVHERIPLEAKKTVYLVEAGDEFMLLGAGESEVSFLTRLDAERMRAVLAERAAAPAPVLAVRPFWERLMVKPPKPSDKDEDGTQGGPAPTA